MCVRRLDRHGRWQLCIDRRSDAATVRRPRRCDTARSSACHRRMNSMVKYRLLGVWVSMRPTSASRSESAVRWRTSILRCEEEVDVLDRKLDASSLSAAKNRDRSRIVVVRPIETSVNRSRAPRFGNLARHQQTNAAPALRASATTKPNIGSKYKQSSWPGIESKRCADRVSPMVSS